MTEERGMIVLFCIHDGWFEKGNGFLAKMLIAKLGAKVVEFSIAESC